MKEANLMREIQLAASKYGARLFRNNIGILKDARGQYIRYGLCNPGGADLIGWTKEGRFLACEVKTSHGKLTEAQDNFLDEVCRAGGIGFVAHSVEEALQKIAGI